MKLEDIINKNLYEAEIDDVVVIEEGIFSVSPVVAALAFKDNVVDKLSTKMEKISHPVSSAVGNISAAAEKIKAKTIGRSGNKDDDTVYALTKEQKKIMAQIYRKYGAEMVNEISKFRQDVMVPYSIIKRSVSKNRMLSNKEVLGMTKEDYFKYRESGRKKIEKKGSYFKDHDDLNKKQIEAREALEDAEEKYNSFKNGKLIDLSAANIEKILDEAGLGRKNLGGWTDVELEKTSTEIEKTLNLLKDENRAEGDAVRVTGRKNSYKAGRLSRAHLELYLKNLQERGYSYAKGEKTEDSNHHGSFKDAFALYALRREEIKKIRGSSLNKDYIKFYDKVLGDAIAAAKKIYEEKYNNFISLKGSVELNSFEKKIWGRKSTGKEYSGNIDDWYLKIKPEDFGETKYFAKSEKIIQAEKEMDRLLKQLERKLKSVMSEEDIALCRKYRLFNNFLTVKELRNPGAMFKGAGEISKGQNSNNSSEDFGERLKEALSKDYNSIRDLEIERDKIKKDAKGKKLSGEEKELLKQLEGRINPKGSSKITKVDRNKINNVIEKINNTTYTGKTQALDDQKELEDTISDFREVNGEEELKQFEASINRAKGKLAAFLEGK
jgi:hypothetical protein